MYVVTLQSTYISSTIYAYVGYVMVRRRIIALVRVLGILLPWTIVCWTVTIAVYRITGLGGRLDYSEVETHSRQLNDDDTVQAKFPTVQGEWIEGGDGAVASWVYIDNGQDDEIVIL